MLRTNLPEYTARVVEKIDNGAGYWSSSRIGIFRGEEQIGEYIRNYSSFGEGTFLPFRVGGKEYALYSKNYTCTRLMSLPDCTDIGGESPDCVGFCPVDYSLMVDGIDGEDGETEVAAPADWQPPADYVDFMQLEPRVALVAGCVWGDDSSWKLEAFDLSRVEEGILTRFQPFGYFELAGTPISEHVRFERCGADEIFVYPNRLERFFCEEKDGKWIFPYLPEPLPEDPPDMVTYRVSVPVRVNAAALERRVAARVENFAASPANKSPEWHRRNIVEGLWRKMMQRSDYSYREIQIEMSDEPIPVPEPLEPCTCDECTCQSGGEE